MNLKSLDEIIYCLENKNKIIATKIEQIKNLSKDNLNMNSDNIEILNTINQNMTIIDDKLDDFNLELLKIQDINSLTYEQKEILREEKFQQIFKKTFLPYILYLRLCMET
tara:strand:+ start:426 stop:755 length:330 start_codon:yes stop_codon:yes gene_type:complete